MSGYRDCACRDCFEIAIGEDDALCSDCESAGCEANNGKCCVERCECGALLSDPKEDHDPDACPYLSA